MKSELDCFKHCIRMTERKSVLGIYDISSDLQAKEAKREQLMAKERPKDIIAYVWKQFCGRIPE